MTTTIKFGTSGWRAIIAEEFTVANVRRAVAGIARYVASKNPNGARVIVGRDPRYMGERFVSIAAEVLGSFGVQPLVIAEPAPTPAISYEVIRSKTDGAINFTASHNPPEYSGIKFSTPDGAPALPEATSAIEVSDRKQRRSFWARAKAQVETSIPSPLIWRGSRRLLICQLIRNSGLKVVFDPLWGAARGYSDKLLSDAGIPVSTVHDVRDVLFGGHAPEPEDHLLNEMRQKMKDTGARIGIATDGDADRFGIVDAGWHIYPAQLHHCGFVRLSG